MPWFEAPPVSKTYGYHWAMNRTQEETAKGRAASHYQPKIGLYDSLDRKVIECHLGWIKLAGFDGVLADWYGIEPHFDYPMIHQRTQLLLELCGKAGLKFGVVYEDQTVKNAIANRLIGPAATTDIAKRTGAFLKENWFKSPQYLKLRGKPAVMVFGPQHFSESDWGLFREGAGPISFLTLHEKKAYADGVYDWPIPSLGLSFNRDFGKRVPSGSLSVPVAFPRFRDYYEEGGREGYPDLDDRSGATYRETLAWAIKAGGDAIQVATWNDWQEGTQIEPSQEVGFRDLEETQAARRQIDPSFSFGKADLELPWRLYQLRLKGKDSAAASKAIFEGRLAEARRALDSLEK